MVEIKRFLIGSKAIFSGYKDFENYTTDTDILIIDGDENPEYGFMTQDYDNDEDIHYIIWKNLSKDDLLLYHRYNCYEGTFIQKFLCPEYAEYFDLTIDELKSMSRLFNYMDDRHSYEKFVYDAYIENNGFYMTEEQKAAAYEEYKRKRVIHQ